MAFTNNPDRIPLTQYKVTFKTGFPKPRNALVMAYSWNDAADRATKFTGREVESVETAEQWMVIPLPEYEKENLS